MIRITLEFSVKMDRPHTLSKWIGITLEYCYLEIVSILYYVNVVHE